jgi:hypothetical protein
MLENINSGAEYAQIVISTILETESEVPEKHQMPIKMLTFLAEEVNKKADINYKEYIIGNRETFLFNDIEMDKMFNDVGERYVSGLLDGMVDKDLLEVSIDDKGEFLYGLSENGKKAADKLFGNNT